MLPRQLHAVVLVNARKGQQTPFCERERARARAGDAASDATLHVPKERDPAPLSTHLLRDSRGSTCSREGQKESMKRKERQICMAQVFNKLIASFS